MIMGSPFLPQLGARSGVVVRPGRSLSRLELAAGQLLQAFVDRETLSQLLGCLPPIDVAGQDDLAGALSVNRRVGCPRWQRPLVPQGLCRLDHSATGPDYQAIGRAQVLVRTVVNRAHA